VRGLLLTLAVLASPLTHADARVGGYARIMARPDLQGGSGQLGYWNLYGRLLNEGPYAALDFDYDILEPEIDTHTPWTTVHMRVEGGSISGADPGNGRLDNFRLSQLYVLAGNVLLDRVTWQVGTLEHNMGDLGLYDMRPATVFFNTVGMSALLRTGSAELLLGAGDAGYAIQPNAYNPVLTAGGSARVGLGEHLQMGGGGQWRKESTVEGHIHAPYDTPNMGHEDWIRGEVLQRFRAEHPIHADRFPDPVPAKAQSGHIFGYLGFGALGPLSWNSTYVRWEQHHPEGPSSETWNGETEDLHTTELTNDRTTLLVGNEMQLSVVPEKLDVAWGALYGNHMDEDNDIVPSDHDRWYASTVLRLQVAITPTLAWLTESSIAKEVSRNGRNIREHEDSIFANTNGVPDTRGLELGDTDTRITWQGKAGLVFNPLGPGIFSRPSLRLLYGLQHSNQNNAFSNHFVTTLDQYNEFGTVEQHWHHVLALEAEAWF
jgi:hypothetical protein